MNRKDRPNASEWKIREKVWFPPKDYSRTVDGVVYFPFGEVCDRVGRTRIMIRRWYQWWESLTKEQQESFPYPLPDYRTDFTERGDRFWKKDDVVKLKQFRDHIGHGLFSDFSSTWRGDNREDE